MSSVALATPSEAPLVLSALVAELRQSEGLNRKRDVQLVSSHLPTLVDGRFGPIHNGDDAAAIPDAHGFSLLAAEGMLPSFARADPWFAGFCAVMVNISDIAAMGGRPLAIVDVLFAGDRVDNARILSGMRDASEAYKVPVVGGHTTRTVGDSVVATAILGRAERLISSFEAQPGQRLLYAVDLQGAYRGGLNFNAATHATAERLRTNIELLPELAERGLVRAGKDVSMAGLLGTLAMLCESSRCGALIELDRVPKPPGVAEARWLQSFPSYGYLLCAEAEHVPTIERLFADHDVTCAAIGEVTAAPQISVRRGAERAVYCSTREPLTGFARSERSPVAQTSAPADFDRSGS